MNILIWRECSSEHYGIWQDISRVTGRENSQFVITETVLQTRANERFFDSRLCFLSYLNSVATALI